MDFSGQAGKGQSTDLIPSGTLAFCEINVRGLKHGKESNLRYADLEFVVTDHNQHPFARRKFWSSLMDPFDNNHKPATKELSGMAICRILEADFFLRNGLRFDESFMRQQNAYHLGSLTDLHGKFCAVRIKIKSGKGEYDDKNEPAEYLTPHPGSPTHKKFMALLNGDFGRAVGDGASRSQGQQGSFFDQATAQQQPQQGGRPAGGDPFEASRGNGDLSADQPQTSTMKSPSDPNATPSWLEQANQK